MKKTITLLVALIVAVLLPMACGDKEGTSPDTPDVQDTTPSPSPSDTISQDTLRPIPPGYADYRNHVFEYIPLQEYLPGTWLPADNCGVSANPFLCANSLLDCPPPEGYGFWDTNDLRYGNPGTQYTTRLVFDEDSAFIEHPLWYAHPSTKSAWYVYDSLRIRFRKKDGSDSLFAASQHGRTTIHQWTRDTMVISYIADPFVHNVFVRHH